MSAVAAEIRRGAYADSIVLMQLQAELVRLPGVEDAGVAMGTAANRELLRTSGLLTAAVESARPDDMVVVVKADSRETAAAALARIDELMQRRGGGDEGEFRPRSLASAVRLLPEATWVLVSIPGRYAAAVAREALDLGRNVFLYSDNVRVEVEVELKRRAASAGLLVMGPDCGTAIVGGTGLGFANRVRVGPVGLVGASGTGLQTVTARLDRLGCGVSQAIGTGGRDLSQEVGGITARQGLELLGRDPDTRVIVLVSKPPAPAVAAELLTVARASCKPVVVHFVGAAVPPCAYGSVRFASGLSEAAELAASLAEGGAEPAAPAPDAPGAIDGSLRALFAGGTLALEAQQALAFALAPIRSNVPIPGVQPMEDGGSSRGHTILDLGADEFTVGRLHPMIDPDLRLRRLRQEAADPETGLLLLDVILGAGAHPDPAAGLAPVIEELRRRRALEVVVLVVGTERDPQGLDEQSERLSAAGATVFDDASAAFAHVAARLTGAAPEPLPAVSPAALAAPLAAVNVGLETFYDSLIAQGARALQLDWRPPAGGDERLAAILERLRA